MPEYPKVRMSGNSILLSETVDTFQASTWIGIDALPSRLFLGASVQDGDLPARAGAFTRVNKIRAIAIAEAERQLCDADDGLKSETRTRWGQRLGRLGG